MQITARVANQGKAHEVVLSTNGRTHALPVPAKESGPGSSANGGELLLLALATCYCNDVYREAAALGIAVERVEVEAEGEFGAAGEPAKRIGYRARLAGRAPADALERLARHTDRVAEVHNTLRLGMPVTLDDVQVESLP